MLGALVLLSIILGTLLSLPGYGEVHTWVHQLSHSLQVDRVGMLPPTDGR
jgi:sulfite exporter TauE/SafE